MKKSFLLLAAAILITGFLSMVYGCSSTEPARPNVILISVDTLRADHLGCYGYERNTSPSIDAFAKDAVLFENAFSTTCWTAPSHMSMFTGLYPSIHKVNEHPIPGRLSEDIRTLTQYLDDSGYITVGYYFGTYLAPELGFGRGFDTYAQKDFIKPALMDAIPFLDDMEEEGEPFFLFLHVGDVHDPYMHPAVKDPQYWDLYDPGYRGDITAARHEEVRAVAEKHRRKIDVSRDIEHIVALYDGAIKHTDRYIGRFFRALERRGLIDNSLIIFTSDHGEEFGEHGAFGHQQLNRELIHVPLIVKLPKTGGVFNSYPSGEVRDENVSTLDIMPTVLGMAGIAPSAVCQGESLISLLDGYAGPERVLYSEAEIDSSGYRSHRSAIDSGFHFIRSQNPLKSYTKLSWERLFDARTDIDEKEDLSDQKPKAVKTYNGRLDAWQKEMAAVRSKVTNQEGEAGQVEFSDEQLERLKALGYVQ